MTIYSVTPEAVHVSGVDAILLRLAFGDPSSNDAIVREVDARMRALKERELTGGPLVLLNGAASLPVIAAISHHVAHLFGAVGIFDPKLSSYVIVISHGHNFSVGDTIAPS